MLRNAWWSTGWNPGWYADAWWPRQGNKYVVSVGEEVTFASQDLPKASASAALNQELLLGYSATTHIASVVTFGEQLILAESIEADAASIAKLSEQTNLSQLLVVKATTASSIEAGLGLTVEQVASLVTAVSLSESLGLNDETLASALASVNAESLVEFGYNQQSQANSIANINEQVEFGDKENLTAQFSVDLSETVVLEDNTSNLVKVLAGYSDETVFEVLQAGESTTKSNFSSILVVGVNQYSIITSLELSPECRTYYVKYASRTFDVPSTKEQCAQEIFYRDDIAASWFPRGWFTEKYTPKGWFQGSVTGMQDSITSSCDRTIIVASSHRCFCNNELPYFDIEDDNILYSAPSRTYCVKCGGSK